MKKGKTQLPTKSLNTRIRFDEIKDSKVFCSLRAELNGKKEESISGDDKKDFMLAYCDHPIYPPIFPHCKECIVKNCGKRYMIDRKGNQMRVVS